MSVFNSPMMIIWGILVLAVLIIAVSVFYRDSSRSLKRKVTKLGNPKGKTSEEICYAIGAQPDSTVRINANKIIKRWSTRRYHVAFAFDKRNICTGMTEQ